MTLKELIIKEYKSGKPIGEIFEKAKSKFEVGPRGAPINKFTISNILGSARKNGEVEKRSKTSEPKVKTPRKYKSRMLTLVESPAPSKVTVIVTDISNLQNILKEIA